MNYALMISNKVEEKLLVVSRDQQWDQHKEKKAYEQCLTQVLNEEDGRAWAEGNVRIGDYILLGKLAIWTVFPYNEDQAHVLTEACYCPVDSDTRVPKDCFMDAASEMERSPEVGIMQYSSGVMQVAHDFFENGIT